MGISNNLQNFHQHYTLQSYFGIDAIFWLDFFIPTLRVAKENEWTWHEMLDMLEELEKIDETHLQVIMGMYAKKCKQKRWNYTNMKANCF